MSKAIITESLLTAIADQIRAKNGELTQYTPAEMAQKIAALSTALKPEGDVGKGLFWNYVAPLLDLSECTDISFLLNGSSSGVSRAPTFNPDVSDWDVSNVTNFSYLFYYCGNANFNPDITKWNTSKATNMSSMFSQCGGAAFNPDLTHLDTSHVTAFTAMFSGCSGAAFNPDLSHFDISKGTNFGSMFGSCSGAAFVAIDLAGWTNTEVSVTCQNMFSGIARYHQKKIWFPSTFKPTSYQGAANYKPLNADPGTHGAHVFTDAADAAAMGWTGAIHSNFTLHYGATHAQFEAFTPA